MRRGPILAGLAVLAVAFAAWRVEAGDGKPTVEDRLAALEAKVAAIEALRAIKMNLALSEVAVRDALRTIADPAKINLIVSPGVGNGPVSLQVEALDLTQILTMLGTAGGFEWTAMGNNVVRITETAAK